MIASESFLRVTCKPKKKTPRGLMRPDEALSRNGCCFEAAMSCAFILCASAKVRWGWDISCPTVRNIFKASVKLANYFMVETRP